jgi:GxxExxY protein
MDTDLIYREESGSLISCAYAVINEIGHGYHEKPYENALVVEFLHRGIPFLQQPRYRILYRGVNVSDFIPDLVAYDKVIVDTKVIPRITDHEIGQMINYLRVTRLQLGLILNFKKFKTRIQTGRAIHTEIHPQEILIHPCPSAFIRGSFILQS